MIDTVRESIGDAGIPERAFRPSAFVEDRFANRAHAQDRKGGDVTSVGLTPIVVQASAQASRAAFAFPVTDATQPEILRIARKKPRNPLDLNSPF